MNVAEIRKAIKQIIARHAEAFRQIGSSQPKLLELAALTGLAQHYKSHNFSIRVVNPKGKKAFTVKTSTRGYPWNFSRILVSKNSEAAELHMNVLVRSAHDEGIYCVDVGIVESSSIPSKKSEVRWVCLENEYLLTFAEVKKLVVYPMLLAQFVGIVHEIKPQYLRSASLRHPSHLPPILVALGHFSGNAGAIVKAYASRGIHITVAENYDVRIARVRGNPSGSPFSN
jgi:hypothetical protein